jgi:DNA-binding IclR family transcriptional regulator
MLADRCTGLRLSEVAAQVGLDVRMAHSLVAVRKSRGSLGLATMHDRYRPGLNPLQLGAIYILQLDSARPSRACGKTSYLARLQLSKQGAPREPGRR